MHVIMHEVTDSRVIPYQFTEVSQRPSQIWTKSGLWVVQVDICNQKKFYRHDLYGFPEMAR